MRCLSCKYDLRKLTVHRCPECGTPFDPDDPALNQHHRRYWFRVARFTLVGLLAVSVVLFAYVFLDELLTDHEMSYRNTMHSAVAIGTTAVMVGVVLFFPIVFISAMLIARWKQ